MPALLLILLLGSVAGTVWLTVLESTSSQATLDCPPPPAVAGAPPSGEVLDRTALDEVPPAPPQLARVQVLNGNGQRGEAAIVSAGLTDLGFRPAAEPANDPLHPTFELNCPGQIRFGGGGIGAARTLSLVVPCAELVRDPRPGDVVDLALGTSFTGLAPNAEAQSVLASLVRLGQPAPPSGAPHGGQAVQGGQAAQPVQPAIDPQQIDAARDVDCEAAR
ncbi:MAG: envelope integrity protein Cei [Actinomycetota bacterium]|nr:envelope integrity protein Cei [Actinomycetota bacterium]